jgi:CubicO group peptidase (beta-lactamase class C family)
MRFHLAFSLLLLPLYSNAQHLSAAAQQALDSLRQAYQIPALAVAVVEPTRLRYALGGVRQRGASAAVQLADYWHLGSNTKAITSFLAAKQVARGRLAWDTRLLDIVPELRGVARPEYQNVTLGDLLAHRAGIQSYTSGAEIAALPALTGTLPQQRLQLARLVLQLPPSVPASGSVYAYSNAGYALAALLLERVTHRSWEQLVAKTCRRLHLRYRLGFPNRHDPAQPWGHWLAQAGDTTLTALGPTSSYRLLPALAPAGDVAMPLPDYARFVQQHLRGLLGQSPYLPARLYQQMHFGLPSYAYGWGVSRVAATGAPVSFHDGSAGTFYCYTVLYPQEQIAFVVLANSGGSSAQKACYALRRRLRQLYVSGQL